MKAFILGKEKKHWRTKDKGRSWQSFETPEPPNFNDNPLAFHVDKDYNGHIIFHSQVCERHFFFKICRQNAFYTTDAFTSSPTPMLQDAIKCLFAHSSKEFKHDAPLPLVFCIAEDKVGSDGIYKFENSRLMSSTNWFKEPKDRTVIDFGIGEKRARGIMALAVISKFAVVALRDLDRSSSDNMELFVSQDANTWARAQFPHASSSGLRENAYTILQGTTHSLAIDVLLRQHTSIGTLFVSNSNGTFFTESLRNTNRSPRGFVDFEGIYGVEGVGIANTVENADSVGRDGSGKKIRSVMTFDDGRTWNPIRAPDRDMNDQPLCQGGPDTCSLHLHSVTDARNYGRIFSSPAPGYVMGIGNAGFSLKSLGEDRPLHIFLLRGRNCSRWDCIRNDRSSGGSDRRGGGGGVTWKRTKKEIEKKEDWGEDNMIHTIHNPHPYTDNSPRQISDLQIYVPQNNPRLLFGEGRIAGDHSVSIVLHRRMEG